MFQKVDYGFELMSEKILQWLSHNVELTKEQLMMWLLKFHWREDVYVSGAKWKYQNVCAKS